MKNKVYVLVFTAAWLLTQNAIAQTLKDELTPVIKDSLKLTNIAFSVSEGSYTIAPLSSGKPHFVGGKLSLGTSSVSKKIYVLDDTRNYDPEGNANVFSIFQNLNPGGYATQEYISGYSGGKLEIGFASSEYGTGYLNSVYANRGTIISRNSSGLILRSTPGYGTYDGITFQTGYAGYDGITPERMRIDAYGNVGIGTTYPVSKLHLSNGNVQLDNGDIFVRDFNRGIILKSPGSNCWRITISDWGDFVKTYVPCPN
ncbi:hypothetical protein [Emticicia soli]|uniref:Uncharacterized protein n=1 Tax=Emticicia soli TaxID=2027878 RepID=A0ABW5JE51_9BACT